MKHYYIILLFLLILSYLTGETEFSPVLKDVVGMGYETKLPSDELRTYWQSQGGDLHRRHWTGRAAAA